jgi:peroxidase
MMEIFERVNPAVPIAERVFLTAATLVRARYQAILWYEFLPLLLGPSAFAALPAYKGYNASVDATASNEFAAAAAFVWHSMLGPAVPRLSADFTPTRDGPLKLRDSYFLPAKRYSASLQGSGASAGPTLMLDAILRGAWATVAQEADALFVDDVRESFVGAHGPGLDLAAVDIQRGRDHGLPSYTRVRAALGLPPVASFADLAAGGGGEEEEEAEEAGAAARASTDKVKRVASRLAEVYGSVEDVDLLVGALLESPLPGGAVGPTFAGILRDQFLRIRDGDRFWFESASHPLRGLQGVVEALGRAKGARMGDLVADNADVKVEAGRVVGGSVFLARAAATG